MIKQTEIKKLSDIRNAIINIDSTAFQRLDTIERKLNMIFVQIANMKAGANQAAAGARANELWQDTSDGNTVKRGV